MHDSIILTNYLQTNGFVLDLYSTVRKSLLAQFRCQIVEWDLLVGKSYNMS